MTDTDAKRARIKDKISASQERLRRDGAAAPARANFPDAYPPEDYRSLAGEYPWLTIAAGLGLGVLAGALLPKGAGGKVGKRALALAVTAGELGLAFSKEARSRAETAGREGIEWIGEEGGKVRRRAGRAAGSAQAAGLALARRAVKLAARARR